MISFLNVLPINALGNKNVHYGFGTSNGKTIVVIDVSNSIGVATDDNICRFPGLDCIYGFGQ